MATATLPIDQALLHGRARDAGHVQSRAGDRSPARTGAARPAPATGETNRPSTEEIGDSLMNGLSGFGIASMTYLGIIPGFIPTMALIALVAVIAMIPLLVVGVLAAPPLLAVRLLRRRHA